MTKRAATPYRNRQRIALGLLLLFGATYVSLLIFRARVGNHTLFEVLLHAMEGGMVGGLCDWFAVWKTYRAAEQRRSEVAIGIGHWVEHELLTAAVIRQELEAVFTRRDVRDSFYLWLDRRVGSADDAGRILRDLLKYVEPFVVEQIVNYELSAPEAASLGAAVSDEEVIRSVVFCAGMALDKLARTEEFARLADRMLKEWPFMDFLNKVFKIVDIPGSVRTWAERMKAGHAHDLPSGLTHVLGADDARVAARTFLAEYIRAWNDYPRERRRAAIVDLVNHLREPAVRAVAKVLVRQKDQLRSVEVLAEYPLLQELRRSVEALLNDDLAKVIGSAVKNALLRIPAAEFRRNLEFQTRTHLELIRINGSALGFLLGSALGLVTAHWG